MESPESYKELFITYYPQLVGFGYKFVRDRDTARDLVQDVFVRIITKQEQLAITTNAKSYLYRAIYNECINFLKKQKFRKSSVEEYILQKDDIVFTDALEQTEEEYRILMTIEALPGKCRDVFVMSRLEGMKNQQIADTLNLSIRTVETHISNALRQLKRTLIIFTLALLY